LKKGFNKNGCLISTKLCGDNVVFSVFINNFFCSYFIERGEKDAEENFTLLDNNFGIE